ncbi:hypothetical protein RND81_13G093500 [Saponaria officinalis]|uniref:Uncharacterized protein n=1 Tax=Saponaria officinalis TaxID=3572 RepID=A0AAW1H228_SAPOF
MAYALLFCKGLVPQFFAKGLCLAIENNFSRYFIQSLVPYLDYFPFSVITAKTRHWCSATSPLLPGHNSTPPHHRFPDLDTAPSRTICVSMYVTMYLNEFRRTGSNEGIGLDTQEFDILMSLYL